MSSPKVLFLYTEMAGYFLACCRALVTKGAEVHVVYWPVNAEAPFAFKAPAGVKLYNRREYNLKQLLALTEEIGPSLIICSGWVDKAYLEVCRKYKKSTATVLTLDNHWKGNIRQQFAVLAGPFYLRRRFSWCWVPGKPQAPYASKLGFEESRILSGFYSADIELFNGMYEKHRVEKNKTFPKRFLYAGRYYGFKGLQDLWEAFAVIDEQARDGWELWCLGTGDLEPVSHPAIKHFGFVQPHDIERFVKDAGVFVLPSHKEPWGVALHEFTAAGFPVVCSDAVGAASAFVKEERNGYLFKAGDRKGLRTALEKMIAKGPAELNGMAAESHALAQQISPANWADALMKITETTS